MELPYEMYLAIALAIGCLIGFLLNKKCHNKPPPANVFEMHYDTEETQASESKAHSEEISVIKQQLADRESIIKQLMHEVSQWKNKELKRDAEIQYLRRKLEIHNSGGT
eukprot:TRINITY_DN7694_c0_g2_i4.p1 TRINITY_DN7694_c0_g2~~TRINITY_DN7694_c0_g2_i4.p1  ORF type:complete len:109 (+),score=33.93 TRINITY_DN7694_c0_g2_i4:114-440(+)